MMMMLTLMMCRVSLLCCLVLAAPAANHGGDDGEELHQHRTLQMQRGCGQTLGVVTTDQVKAAGAKLLSPFLNHDAALLLNSVDIITLPIKYDFTVVKLCSSCKDLADWYFYERGGLKFPGYHATYCPENSTATYQQSLSMLVFLPRDPDNFNQLPPAVRVRTFLTLPPTTTRLYDAPSAAFPSSALTDADYTPPFLTTYWPGMVAASAGAIGLYPDYPGLGESAFRDNIYRSIYRRRSYEQATAVSFLALKKYVGDVTKACTVLDDAVTIHGAEDGAFGAAAATQVLQRFNVRSLTTFLQAGPLDLEILLQDAVQNHTATNSSSSSSAAKLGGWIALAAYTLSAGVPDTYNAVPTNVSLVADQYQTALLAIFAPKPQSSAMAKALPVNTTELLRPDFVALLRQGNGTTGFSPCNATIHGTASTNSTNASSSLVALCEAVLAASVYDILQGQTDRQWIYPTSVCYSDDDEIVSPRHYTSPPLPAIGGVSGAISSSSNSATEPLPQWQRYTQPSGNPALLVTGDHAAALQLCALAPVLFFTLGGHKPVNAVDQGNYMASLSPTELAQCVPVVPADSSTSTTTNTNTTAAGNIPPPPLSTPNASPATTAVGGSATVPTGNAGSGGTGSSPTAADASSPTTMNGDGSGAAASSPSAGANTPPSAAVSSSSSKSTSRASRAKSLSPLVFAVTATIAGAVGF